MAMVVQHNMQALNSNRMLGITTSAQAKSTEKLSSGYKINRAADDAAGLTISEKMRKQMRGLDRASTNAQDGVSAVQTAEGALTEVHSMLQRMNELAVQSANGTNSESDRTAIQNEIDQLTTEIDRVSETTKFNETYLLKGNTQGTTSDVWVAAHDAGLAGKLTDHGNTAGFKLDKALANGDKVTIAGEQYTIGNAAKSQAAGEILSLKDLNTDTSSFTDTTAITTLAYNGAANGTVSSFRYDGTDYTLTDKITMDDVTFTTGTTASSKFVIGDCYYVVSSKSDLSSTINDGHNAASAIHITASEAKKLIAQSVADDKQVYLTNFGTTNETGVATAAVAVTTQVVAEYGENEIRKVGLTGTTITALAQMVTGDKDAGKFKEGDSVTIEKNGESTTYTMYTKPAAAKDVYNAIKALAKDGTQEVRLGKAGDPNTKTYIIIADSEEEDASSGKLHMDTILSMIHDKDLVNYGAKGTTTTNTANDKTVIGDIGVPTVQDGSAEKVISIEDAYAKMAEELQKASSIGADEGKGATVVNKGDGTFQITKGFVNVKDPLSFSLHVGADADMTNKIQVDFESMSAAGLGVKGLKVDGDTVANATYAIDAIADAISKVSAQRSALGAVQNRLEHTIANLDNVVENTTSAESRIRDTDMAEEMVEYSKNNILAQAGQSMLAQANQSTQGVLSLLG